MDCGLLETRLHARGFATVAGTDEVGRGALAGPLVAAAVILPPDVHIEGLRDSKMCTRLQRERLAEQIEDVALALSIVRVRHDRIDRDGLQRCNLQALRKALNGLDVRPDYALIDGFRLKRMTYPSLAVKKGDAVSRSVAAASIVAKVYRDKAMKRYHKRFPSYGFATNVGYGTREHWDALISLGPCEIHRRSFYGVTGLPEEGSARSTAGRLGETPEQEDRRAKRMRQRGDQKVVEARDLERAIEEASEAKEMG